MSQEGLPRVSRRQFIRSAVVAAIGLPLVAACAPSPKPSGTTPAATAASQQGATPAPATAKPVEIDLWQHDSGGKIKGVKAIIDEFVKANPNISIKQTSLPYDDYQTKIAASVPAGTGPDVAMSYFGWIPLWSKSGFIVPLPDDLANEVNSQFVPFAEITKLNGKQYSVLTSVRNFALFYNKKLLQQAGVSQPPKTLDEFVATAKKCTKYDSKGNITQAGYFLGWEEDGWNFWRPVIQMFGGQFCSEDGRQTLFNKSEGAKQAWKWLLDLTLVHKVSTPNFYESEQQAFAAGLSAMSFQLTFSVGFFQENAAPGVEWAVAPIPAGPKGSYTTGSSWPLVLTAQASKKAEKLDAAIKFLKYTASKDGQRLYNDVTKELPSRKDMLSDPKYTADPIMKPFIDGLPQTTGVFWADELAERQCAFDMYNAVMKNNVDPMKALDDGAACDQAIRDKFFAS